MWFMWTDHAFSLRLKDPTRTLLTKEEIEDRLAAEKYVITYPNGTKLHLIWDERREAVIQIPVLKSGKIVTITPVEEHEEWRLAEAERAWCPETYWRRSGSGSRSLETVPVWLARHAGDRYTDAKCICAWKVFEACEARKGKPGLFNLMRSFEFRLAVRNALERHKSDVDRLANGHDPMIHLKKNGAWRFIPLDFFLNAP